MENLSHCTYAPSNREVRQAPKLVPISLSLPSALPKEPTPKRRRRRGVYEGDEAESNGNGVFQRGGATAGTPIDAEHAAPAHALRLQDNARLWPIARVRHSSKSPLACTVNICVPEGGAVRFPQLEEKNASFLQVCRCQSHSLLPPSPPHVRLPPPRRQGSPSSESFLFPPPVSSWRCCHDRSREREESNERKLRRHGKAQQDWRTRRVPCHQEIQVPPKDEADCAARMRALTEARVTEPKQNTTATTSKTTRKATRKAKHKSKAAGTPSFWRRLGRGFAHLFGCMKPPVVASQSLPGPAFLVLPVGSDNSTFNSATIQNLVRRITEVGVTKGNVSGGEGIQRRSDQTSVQATTIAPSQNPLQSKTRLAERDKGLKRLNNESPLLSSPEEKDRETEMKVPVTTGGAPSCASTDTMTTGVSSLEERPRLRAIRRRPYVSISSSPVVLSSPSQPPPPSHSRPERYVLDVSIRFSEEMAPSVSSKLVSPTGSVKDVPTRLFPLKETSVDDSAYEFLLPQHPYTTTRWKMLAQQMPCIAELQRRHNLTEHQSKFNPIPGLDSSRQGNSDPGNNFSFSQTVLDHLSSKNLSKSPNTLSSLPDPPNPGAKPGSPKRKSSHSPACSRAPSPRTSFSHHVLRECSVTGHSFIEEVTQRPSAAMSLYPQTDEFLQLMRKRYGPVTKANAELREIMQAIRERREPLE